MDDQLNLFETTKSIKLGNENKICVHCGELKPVESFIRSYVRQDGKVR